MQRPEEGVQKAGLEMIEILYPVGIAFHIPNQRFGKALRMILKSLGVLAGMPDIGVLRPYGRIGWIEFKSPEAGKTKNHGLTDSQDKLHPRMAVLWHHVEVVWDIDQLQPIIRQWRIEDASTEKALANAN